jgi:hypothetical protein
MEAFKVKIPNPDPVFPADMPKELIMLFRSIVRYARALPGEALSLAEAARRGGCNQADLAACVGELGRLGLIELTPD